MGSLRLADVQSSPSGYEYRILVTVWSALELMLAKGYTGELVVEPPSLEDIEARLDVPPDHASSGVHASGAQYHLLIQVKSRSTGPWGPAAIAEILSPRTGARSSSGPARRRSPIELLAEDERRRYVLITNAALSPRVADYQAESLLDWPEDGTGLPEGPGEDLDPTMQASVARRIALYPQRLKELLRLQINESLSLYGHVPAADHAACLQALMSDARRRLLGELDARWTLEELVGTLSQHHGSLRPSRAMDHYVKPSTFEAIRRTLDQHHVVVIEGPSGTGKTLTADVLEDELRRAPAPFSVVTTERGPGSVYAELTRRGPVLFHLRDPWGTNELGEGATSWSQELPKLLEQRGPGRKFLITTRSDILLEAGSVLQSSVKPFKVSIEIEHYGPERLAEIYDSRVKDLSVGLAAVANSFRYRVLRTLQRLA